MSWIEGPFMGFDTETTGVKPATDRIAVSYTHLTLPTTPSA